MDQDKFSIQIKNVKNILGYIFDDSISIPEIQRPFVWDGAQVRDLIDSMYNGYPVGFIVIWQNPDIYDKRTGKLSAGKKILIDGQQRVTALMTSLCGIPVLDKNFEERPITIAFNPFAEDGKSPFEVTSVAIRNDKRWIPDISIFFKDGFDPYSFVPEFCDKNPEMNKEILGKKIMRVISMQSLSVGIIELSSSLTIDEVTEIFIRINSKGSALTQADFVMSTLAADEQNGGNTLRKAIDYFCHLATSHDFLSHLDKDEAFASSEYCNMVYWIGKKNNLIYIPTFDDVLRVAFMSQYDRGKLANLVDLLHGRDFKTRTYQTEIVVDTFSRFSEGVKLFLNSFNFTNFIEIILKSGFVEKDLLRSRMAIDFAYALSLRLRNDRSIEKTKIQHYVSKWYVMSILTGRYTGSPESAMERDWRAIRDKGFLPYFDEVMENLSDTFWQVTIPQALQTSSTTAPAFLVFQAAQCQGNDDSFFGYGAKVRDLLESAELHHLFPKQYLRDNNITETSRYNQVANYAYLGKTVNAAIGKLPPCEYMQKIYQSHASGELPKYTNITDPEQLKENLRMNCIPENFGELDYNSYDDFLEARRKLMAQKIRKYFESL